SVDRADRTKMSISTPALAEGKYTVKWHTVTEDDNGIEDGTLAFTVAGATTQTTGGTSEQSSSGTSDSLPQAGVGQNSVLLSVLALCAVALAAMGMAIRRRATR